LKTLYFLAKKFSRAQNLLLYCVYEQTFRKNRRAVRQNDKANRKKKKRERCPRYGNKGIQIGAFAGW
jgi:hypothetical protein